MADALDEDALDEDALDGDGLDEHGLDEALRSRGLRGTPQRRAVLRAVAALRHATAEQVAEHATSGGEELSLATAYRSLELLEELGLVAHTHLQHGAPTYHLARAADHVHLVCHECGRTSSASMDLVRPLAAAVQAASGFRTDLAHLALHGTCRDCAEAEPPSGGQAGAAGAGAS